MAGPSRPEDPGPAGPAHGLGRSPAGPEAETDEEGFPWISCRCTGKRGCSCGRTTSRPPSGTPCSRADLSEKWDLHYNWGLRSDPAQPRRPGQLPLRGRLAPRPAPRRHPGRRPRGVHPAVAGPEARPAGGPQAHRLPRPAEVQPQPQQRPHPRPGRRRPLRRRLDPLRGREHRRQPPADQVPPAQRPPPARRPGPLRLRGRAPGRVERSTEATAVPQLDAAFFPPLLACDAWDDLSKGIVQEVYHRVGRKIERLAAQVLSRRVPFESQTRGAAPDLRAAPRDERGVRDAGGPRLRRGGPPAEGLPGAGPAGRPAGDLRRRDAAAAADPALRPRRPGRLLLPGQDAPRRAAGRGRRARLQGAALRRRRLPDADPGAGAGLAGLGLGDVHRGAEPAGARAVRRAADRQQPARHEGRRRPPGRDDLPAAVPRAAASRTSRTRRSRCRGGRG